MGSDCISSWSLFIFLLYWIPTSPSASFRAQNIQLFGPLEGFLTHQWVITGNNKSQINTMMKKRWGLDRNNVLRPTPEDPWGVEQHHWNTGASENQQLNPGGPSNRQKSSGPKVLAPAEVLTARQFNLWNPSLNLEFGMKTRKVYFYKIVRSKLITIFIIKKKKKKKCCSLWVIALQTFGMFYPV